MAFNFPNISSMFKINDMLPSTNTLKSKLPGPIQKFVPDIDIGKKLDIDGKINQFIGPQMTNVESEMNEHMNSAFSEMNNLPEMPEGIEVSNPLDAISFEM